MSMDEHGDIKRFTPDQKPEIALRYAGCTKGHKGAYTQKLGLKPARIRK